MRHKTPPAPFPRHLSRPASRAPRILGDDGRAAFPAILSRIQAAKRSIAIHAFVWRDDETGNALGSALLAAADRGVSVTIFKDRVAAVYEYTGGNKQSFFHKRVDPVHGFQAWFLGRVYGQRGSFRQRPSDLATAILAHPSITVEHRRKRFDHSKLFIVDDEAVSLGSMNVGDNHHHEWIEIMVEVEGAEHVTRLRDHLAGGRDFDPSRGVDFLVHTRREGRGRLCPMVHHRLGLIESAERSLTVEMAYLGDRRFTKALTAAVKRGIDVTLVTAAQADILGNLNRATCDALMRQTGAPSNLTIVLLPRMVHSKAVIVDHRYSDVGSANFTPLSHGVYDEVNLYADSEPFARALEETVDRHAGEGIVAKGSILHKKFHTQVEKAIVAYQSRRGG